MTKTTRQFFLFLFLSSLLSVAPINFANATPARILIIRHAEKPATPSDDLSPQGYQRAQALTGLFSDQPALASFGLPVALYAAEYIPGKSANRCVETLTPLSQSLQIALKDNLQASDEKTLATEIMSNPAYNGKMVMIAYPHGQIPTLATTLGVTNAPSSWPSSAYDRIWQLDYHTNGDILFSNLPQKLLPGDSPN